MTELHTTCRSQRGSKHCPCRRLLDPWNTDSPPEFVCLPTLRASVRQWVDEQTNAVYQSLTTSNIGLRPVSMSALASMKPRLARSLSGLIEVVEEEHLLERWPFPLADTHLALVVRQWVQEKPSETFANLLLSDPDWSARTTKLRDLWERAKRGGRANPGRNAPRLFENVTDLLTEIQVPTSPANVAYGVGHIIGDDDIAMLPTRYRNMVESHRSEGQLLPARGVLLTTQVFATLTLYEDEELSSENSEVAWMLQPNAKLQLSGDLAHVTDPFVRDHLASAVFVHRNFVRSLARHPFTETSAVRKAQPGHFRHSLPAGERAFDYIEEARREARSQRDTLSHLGTGWKLDGAVDQLLDRVHKRVAQRCKRAQLSQTPPKGWRAEAQRLIRQDLET